MSGQSTSSLRLQLATAFAEGRAVHQWATRNGLPSQTAVLLGRGARPESSKEKHAVGRKTQNFYRSQVRLCAIGIQAFGSQTPPLTSKSVECALSSRFDRASAPNTDELLRHKVANYARTMSALTNARWRWNHSRPCQIPLAL